MTTDVADINPRTSVFQRCVMALGALFVLYLLNLAVSDHLSRHPAIALLLNPANAGALVFRAEAALDQDSPDRQSAKDDASAALRADPLVPGVYRTLRRIAEEASDEERAAAMSPLAARFARDGEAQVEALRRALAGNDFDAAIRHLDLLFRGQSPGLWSRIAQSLAGAVSVPEFTHALGRKLAEEPPWRRTFLQQLFVNKVPVDPLIDLYELLPNSNDAEARLLMERLVREGRLHAALSLFVRRLPPERLTEPGLLYNARFQHGVSNFPFDWVITPMPNTLTEVRRDRNRRVLRVSFFGGRTPYRNVSRLLALPAGAYVLAGREEAAALDNPRGTRWRLACVDKLDQVIAATPLLTGDVAERPFSVRFEIPQGCPFQILQLELAARVALETEANGSVIYSDLSLSVAQ
jgi:hypothetical protein